MSFLKKSLEKRIEELRASIEAQKTELAAYEQVLALESGKPGSFVAPAAAPSAAKQPKRGRISEEGMKRIIAATKKRWAKQRAAKAKAKTKSS